MKILETIQGATANIVVYDKGNGVKETVSRPPFISIEDVISEIEENEKKDNLKKVETQGKNEKHSTTGKTPVNPSKTLPNEPKAGGGVSNQKDSAKNSEGF